MRLQNTCLFIVVASTLATAGVFAQSKQYQRKKAPPASAANAPAGKGAKAKDAKGKAGAPPAAAQGDKLDISELEQKYWAPKDTDFSVVQNRTYTKAERFAVSALMGPPVNDPYNAGLSYAILGNYYFSERYGVEFQYITADLSDSDATKEFKGMQSGGGIPPDFNRPVSFYGVGFNWVPFYAKMSFLGSRILYFDMQFTPIIGMSSYDQQTTTGGREKSAFTYGIDVTQYFFVHKNFAFRFNLQNRWSQQEIIANAGTNPGTKLRDDSDHTSVFLFGLTYFH